MTSNIRLGIYGFCTFAGLVWPFYFIAKFIGLIVNGSIDSTMNAILGSFWEGAWISPASGFVSADTAILLIAIFLFYANEGKRLKMKLWGIYFPLTFLISLAFSFGLFMFMREKSLKE